MQTPNTRRRRQITRSRKWSSRIFKMFGFDPKKSKFRFKNAHNIKHFEDTRKTGVCVRKIYENNKCSKFQANTFIFGFAMARQWTMQCNGPMALFLQSGKGNDVTFWKSIFGISKCRTTKQTTFLNPETKLDEIGMFLNENFYFRLWRLVLMLMLIITMDNEISRSPSLISWFISDFQYFGFFDHQKAKYWCFKDKHPKIRNFKDIEKTVIHT